MIAKKLLLTTLLAAWTLLQMSGCSLIGLGLGSIGDASKPDEYVFTPSGADSIKRGATIEITKTDSSVISGDIDRVAPLSSPEYTARYRQAMQSLPIGKLMPELGDNIIILMHVPSGRKIFTGQLLGFDNGLIHMHRTGRTSPDAIHVEGIDTLWNGKPTFVSGDVLRGYMNNTEIPFMSAIVIADEVGTQVIYACDILEVRQPVSKHGALLGFVIGAAVDATMLLFVTPHWKFP